MTDLTTSECAGSVAVICLSIAFLAGGFWLVEKVPKWLVEMAKEDQR